MISIIIPVYNEEKIIQELLERLKNSIKNIGLYEIIFVDDGSTDKTRGIILESMREIPEIKYIRFSRNFGHQIAITAGLKNASGQAAVIIDGDLQDPPELIPDFIKKWHEGARIVYAIRKKRKENIFKRASYSIYYRILAKIANINIPLDSGDFCLIDREAIDFLNALPEHNRFIRGLRSWTGFESAGIEYERDARFAGETKYTFGKLVKLALDGVTGFSVVPLRLAVYLGFAFAIFAFIFGLAIIIRKIFFFIDVDGWASLSVIVLFMAGIQLAVIGILGEYIGRIYIEAQNRPFYVIKETVGFNKKVFNENIHGKTE